MAIKNRIRLAIEAQGLSLREAATLCNISYSSLQNWVSGLREPRPNALILLGSHLGVSIDWLLTGMGAMLLAGVSNETPWKPVVNSRQDAILDLFYSLGESDQREIQSAIEEKMRLRNIEQRLESLTIALAEMKGSAQ